MYFKLQCNEISLIKRNELCNYTLSGKTSYFFAATYFLFRIVARMANAQVSLSRNRVLYEKESVKNGYKITTAF